MMFVNTQKISALNIAIPFWTEGIINLVNRLLVKILNVGYDCVELGLSYRMEL